MTSPEELAKNVFPIGCTCDPEVCHFCLYCDCVETIRQDRLSIRKRCAEVAKEVIDLNKLPDYEVPIWVHASDVIAKAIEELPL